MCHTVSSYRSRVVRKIEWLISSASKYVEYRRLPIVYILAGGLFWKEELQKEQDANIGVKGLERLWKF
jgi:hypothetical protein